LSKADFKWANLNGANFTDADLRDADMSTLLDGAIFTNTIYNKNTKWLWHDIPHGTKLVD